jgi:hypothetical protein
MLPHAPALDEPRPSRHPLSMARAKHGPCALCGRTTALTFHHLVPRTLRRNRWFRRNLPPERFQEGIDVCRPCHKAIHRFIDEKTLGRRYASREALLEHPELAAFIAWVRTQDPGARIRMR